MISAFAVKRAPTLSGRLLQIVVCRWSLSDGAAHPLRENGAPSCLDQWRYPDRCCLFGVWLGLGLLYQRWKATLLIVMTVIGATLWVLLGGATSEVSRATERHLRRLVPAASGIPSGEARFGALMQVAFAPFRENTEG